MRPNTDSSLLTNLSYFFFFFPPPFFLRGGMVSYSYRVDEPSARRCTPTLYGGRDDRCSRLELKSHTVENMAKAKRIGSVAEHVMYPLSLVGSVILRFGAL